METSNPAPPLGEIGQIAMAVSNLEVAVAYYRDLLGLPLLFTAPPSMAFFQAGNVRLMLSQSEKPGETASSTVIYFRVADIDGQCESLSRAGVRFERDAHFVARMPDHELWMAFFRDPDQHLLAFMCEKRG
jgi:methylmalonyl-CoA/ethylmalonyl-CoA epimerase